MAKKITTKNKISIESNMQAEMTVSPIPSWAGIAASIILIIILSAAGSMDSSVEKWAGLFAAILILILLFLKGTTAVLKKYNTPLFYAFTAYVIWGGISTFYAASGKFAVSEFSKLLVAFCVYLAVLFLIEPSEKGFKKIAYLIASTGSFFGILAVDAASFGILFKIFKLVFGTFTTAFDVATLYEQGIRIYGIFGNANTYAGFMALAVILSLYLVIRSEYAMDSRIAVSLLAVNALAYLLAFSMGSLFMFLIACLVMIGFSQKKARISLFILMVETAVLAFLFAFIAMVGLGKTGAVAMLPILALILYAVALNIADERFRPILSDKMSTNIKAALIIVAVIVILIAAYLVAAVSVSSQLSLTANANSIMRAVYVPGGEYTLSIESESPVTVIVQSQNQYDLMRRTAPIIYSGSNENEIKFTVPDDSKIVKINLMSATDNVITSANYSGTESGNIHLNYPLLPGFIANRIQNLFANENLIQRTIFFEDGMKLFSKSPLIGRGLGGFENGVYSVQDFYYQTKYAHNHYIQALCDLGALGFVLFTGILGFSALAVIKARKHSRSLFAVPVLAACTVQIFGQALVDAVWSTIVFLAFAAAVLAAITIFCSEPLKLKETFNRNGFRIFEKTVLTVFTCVFVLLLSGNLFAQAQAKKGVESFDDIERLIMLDRFEYNDYKLSYILNAVQSNDQEVAAQADIYASELSKVESNSLTPYVMAYDYQKYYDSDAYTAAKDGVKNNKSNPNFWIKTFDTFEEYIDPVGPHVDDAADRLKSADNYVRDVLNVYDLLLERNKNSLDDVTLSPSNNAFIGKLLEIEASNLYSVDWVFTAIMTYAFDSVCAVDADQNGLPDAMTIKSGSAEGKENGIISVTDQTVLDFTLYHKLHGTYTFKVETEAPQGIKILYNDQEQTVTYEKRAAFITIDLEDNSNRDVSKFTVAFPTASEVDAVTFTTKLEE